MNETQFPRDPAAEVQAGPPTETPPKSKRGKTAAKASSKPAKPRKKREEPESVRLARDKFKADLLKLRSDGKAAIAATREAENSAKRIAKFLARVTGWPKRDQERLLVELTKLVTPALLITPNPATA